MNWFNVEIYNSARVYHLAGIPYANANNMPKHNGRPHQTLHQYTMDSESMDIPTELINRTLW